MTANQSMNLGTARDAAERDALGSNDGLAVGDFCLVDQGNLYTAVGVAASSSTWQPLAGVPTTGPYGVGTTNTADSLPGPCYVMTAVSFRAVLDAAPSSVTIASSANFNWPAPPVVILATATGFVLAGTSATVAARTNVWNRGTYTINY